MNGTVLTNTLALGALTGMRSMAGPAALALPQGGLLGRMVGVLAAGELAADKTPFVGNRTDAGPLAGRAVIGAIVGGVAAHQGKGNVLAGALVGGAAAFAMAHVAFRLRQRLPKGVAGGLIEDAVVMGLGGWYARQRTS